jgi:hypothetical protein
MAILLQPASQASAMNARFLKRWTTWLLPLLVLRAFIPMGFMLSSGPQGLQLTFCPGVMQAAGGHSAVAGHAAQARDVGSHHHGSQPGGAHQQHEHAPCPYGLAGAAASVQPFDIVLDRVTADVSNVLPSTPLFARTPVRAEQIRGPPAASRQALI